MTAADLAKPGAGEELDGTLEARGMQVDVLVNTAGRGGVGRFDQIEPQRVSDMLMINVVALTELTRLLVPGMVARRRGKVLLVASTASFQPGPRMAVYFATKAYVLSLGEAPAYEGPRTGVPVPTLCPGATATNFFKAAGANEIALQPSMSAAEVARIGYRALTAALRVALTRIVNPIPPL